MAAFSFQHRHRCVAPLRPLGQALAAATLLIGSSLADAAPIATPIAISTATSTAHAPAADSSADPLSIAERQAALARFADTLDIRYRLLDNTPGPHCKQQQAGGACFTVELTLSAATALAEPDWTIYFSHVAPVQSSHSDAFTVRHLNGDLHALQPLPAFNGFAAGDSNRVVLQAPFWLLSKAELMPNYFIVAPDLQPQLIRSSSERFDADTGLPHVPFAADLVDPIKHLRRTPADRSVPATAAALYHDYLQWGAAQPPAAGALVPTPRRIQIKPGQLSLTAGITLQPGEFARPALAAALQRLQQFGVGQTDAGTAVRLHKVPTITLPPESYVLDISADHLDIVASDDAGAFYALQSLAALLQPPTLTVPLLRIEDGPRYPFRGLHIDIARNFHGKTLLLKVLDQMAAYKLNKLHLHLADDEGWRLQIPGLPELTDIGAFRCHDPSEQHCLLPQLGSGPFRDSPVNGYLSTDDYLALLRAAQARHIQVIPSLDMPGHARAAVRSMRARHDRLLAAGNAAEARRFLLDDPADQSRYESIQFYRDNTINVCLPSAYRFVETIVSELAKLHQQAGQPLTRFHVGADETPGAWTASPACRDFLAQHRDTIADSTALAGHFLRQVGALLHRRGIELAAWSDGLEQLTPAQLPGTVQANAWGVLAWQGHRAAHRLANLGWQVVVSSPDVTYFDFPYAVDPDEGGYYWGTRSSSTRKVFEFMPDNLPAHAELWRDREQRPYDVDDRELRDDNGQLIAAPLQPDARFHGLQGQLWSETLRHDRQVEYMLFPRLVALAERAWHHADWELPYRHDGAQYSTDTRHFDASRQAQRQRDWQQFASLLATRELAKLDQQQIHYRLPTVGAVIRAGQLHAHLPYRLLSDGRERGLGIEYRDGGGIWQRYRSPVAVTGPVEVRAVSPDGRRKGRTLPVPVPTP